MGELHTIVDDPLTLVLLGALVLLSVPPVVFMTAWRVTRLPFQARSFRWMYLAWALLLGATSTWTLSRDVSTTVEEAGAGNFVRMGFLMLGLLVILFLSARYRFVLTSELATGSLGIFFAFSLWGLASTLWSVLPASTLYKSVEYSTMFVLFALTASLITLTIRDPQSQMLALKSLFDWNWFLILVMLMSVYIGVVVLPEYAIMQGVGMLGFSLSGALPAISANGVGQLAAILGIVALVRVLHGSKSKVMYIPVLLGCLLTMVLAQSRSPILAFLLAAVVVLIASRRLGLLALLVGSVSLTLLSAYGGTVYEFMRRDQSEGNVQSLSGRTVYWESSLQAVRDNWLNGYGANAGGKYILSSLGEGASTVHSTYVEVLLDTGIVGLGLLLAGLIVAWFWLLKLRSHVAAHPIGRQLWFECLGVFIILSLRSVFTITFVWAPAVLVFGLVLVYISVARRQVVQRSYTSAPRAQQLPAARWRRPGVYR
jgi:O-antigen ligase